jgi:hypothetical protein
MRGRGEDEGKGVEGGSEKVRERRRAQHAWEKDVDK